MTEKEIKEKPEGKKEPPRPVSWDEAKEQIKVRRQKTETQRYNFGDGTCMEFEYRGLNPSEKNFIDAKMSDDEKKIIRAEMTKRNRARVSFRDLPTEDNSLKWTMDQHLFFGIISGPPGFNVEDQSIYMKNIGTLPSHVRSDLVDRIDVLSDLDIEIEEKFRGVGQGQNVDPRRTLDEQCPG